MSRFRKRVGMVAAISAAILGIIAYIATDYYRDAKEKEKDKREKAEERERDIARQRQELKKFVALEQQSKTGQINDQAAIDSITNKEDTPTDLPTEALPIGGDAPPPPPADISAAREHATDKLFIGHDGAVWSVRYSPPGLVSALPGKLRHAMSLLLTAGHDQTARAWDLKSEDDFVLRGHRGEVNYALFNPKPPSDANGWVAATASDDGTAALWRASEPSKPLFLKGHTGPVTGLAWSKDGNWLATTSKDKQVRIWNVAAPEKPPLVLAKHTGEVWLPTLVELGDNKSLLLTPSSDGTARLWNFPGGEPCTFSAHEAKDREVLRHGAAVRRAAMDSQARWIVTAGADRRAILWNRTTGELLLVVNHEEAVRDVAFKPQSSLFVTASSDNTAQVWDADDQGGQLAVVTLKGHTGPLYSARFTPYGPGVVTVSWDRTARLWNYETKRCVAVLKGHLSVLWSVEFSPDGTSFVTTSGDGTARLWDLKQIPGGDAFLPPPPASAK